MARKKSQTLTEAELRLMDVLWEKQRATIAELRGALAPPQIAYNTVLTTMRILEQKGYVRHEEDGRAYVYIPIVKREEASSTAVSQLLNRFFGDSPGALALKLLESEHLDHAEIERLKQLIKHYEDRK